MELPSHHYLLERLILHSLFSPKPISVTLAIVAPMSDPLQEADAAAPTLQDMTAEASLSLADSMVIDEQLDEAVDAYAAAISLLSDGPKNSHQELHIRALSHRSAAFYQLSRYQEALDDAQSALEVLSEKHPQGLRPGEGELCHKRAGLAAFQLGDYAKAQLSLEQAKQLATLNKRSTAVYTEWIQKCNDKLNPSTKTTTQSLEEAPSPAAPEIPIVEDIPSKPKATPSPAAAQPLPVSSSSTSKPAARPQMPKYQYYQSDIVMTISVLEANVQPEDLNVTFEPKRLTVRLQKGGVDFTVIAGNLYSEVVVDRCKVVYKDEKVLIKLRKKDPFDWHELFGKASLDDIKPAAKKQAAAASSSSDVPKAIPIVNEEEKPKIPRPYASHKDWDAIERDVLEDEKNEKPEGDEAMNKLFQQIYSNASEETRRAMIKSYQTSGGTVLSTNWDEVSKKDYEKERTAPDGIEWKNWEGKKLPMKDGDDK